MKDCELLTNVTDGVSYAVCAKAEPADVRTTAEMSEVRKKRDTVGMVGHSSPGGNGDNVTAEGGRREAVARGNDPTRIRIVRRHDHRKSVLHPGKPSVPAE